MVDLFFTILQTILKLLVGQDDELRHIIPILLGCSEKDVVEGNYVQMSVVPDVVDLMKETAFSHLMEVRWTILVGVSFELMGVN